MGRNLTQHALITLLICGATLGCQSKAVKNKASEDPLLVTKKPVSGRTYVPGADSQVYLQQPTPPPPMPVAPSFATTSLPPEPLGPDVAGR